MSATLLAVAAAVAAGLALRPRPPKRHPDSRSGPSGTARARREASATWRPARRVPVADPLVLAAWCDALSRSVRGGSTIRHAIATVPPPECAGPALDPVVHALDRGAGLADALDHALGQRHTPPHLDLVLVVLRACAEHGGAAGEPIDRCAAALRQRAALLAERRSQSAQARMSATVMTLLPVVLLAVLVLTSAPVRSAAITPLGVSVVAFGAAVNAAGWWWMRRLIAGGARWR